MLAAPPAQAAKRGSNGQLAYFTGNTTTAYRIVRKSSDGSGVVTPVTDAAGFYEPSWSPDGLMMTAKRNGVGIVIFPSRGGHPAVLDGDPNDLDPSRSPDGRFVAFTKGSGELVILPVDLSTGPIVVASGGFGPDWSANGHALAYYDATGTLFTVGVVPSVDVPVPRTPANTVQVGGYFREVSWSPDGNRIVYAKPGGGLAYVRLGNQAPTSINGTAGAFTPAWSPDGQKIAFMTALGGIFTTPVHDGTVKTVDPTGFIPDWEACRYHCGR